MRNFFAIGLLLFLINGLSCVVYASDESLYKNELSFNLGYGIASDTTLNRISLFGEESNRVLDGKSHFSTFESSDGIDTEGDSYANLGGVYVELGGSSDPDTVLGGTGFWAEVSDYVTLKGGLSLLARLSLFVVVLSNFNVFKGLRAQRSAPQSNLKQATFWHRFLV